MLIWIAIYSAFNSIDFNDEVVVLYGEVTFWATVLVTTCVALGKIIHYDQMSSSRTYLPLGPRFIVKFVSSSFFPLDRDIVREMWVKGDLKKQLGIQSRKAHKVTPSVVELGKDVECRPMCHDRSISEGSQLDGYEPAPTRSPGDFVHEMTPPQTVGIATHSPKARDWQEESIASSSHVDLQYVVAGEPDASDLLTPGPHMSPGRSPVSPHPSYYSASDIPAPSPMPPPRYSYYNPEPGPTFVAEPVVLEDPRTPTSLHPPQHDRHDGSFTEPSNAFEMQVRSPPPTAFRAVGSRSPYLRAGSQASDVSYYATASEKWDDSEDDRSTINQGHSGRRDSSYSSSPRAL